MPDHPNDESGLGSLSEKKNANPPATGLGSLAQAARGKTLGTARGILIFVGVLTAVVNLAGFFMAEKSAQEAIDMEIKGLPRGNVPPEILAEAKATYIKIIYLISGATVGLGVVFIILGIFIYQIPVVATVLGLVLYLGGNLVFGFLDPATFVKGVIIKILIVVGLVKAVQSAIAYQKEMKSQTPVEGS
ncbi:MAG: hypothetical protein EXR99_11185 [Gemmataceae bacterium]|nr:hypothetical protein [Gemmataceae bacterium]